MIGSWAIVAFGDGVATVLLFVLRSAGDLNQRRIILMLLFSKTSWEIFAKFVGSGI